MIDPWGVLAVAVFLGVFLLLAYKTNLGTELPIGYKAGWREGAVIVGVLAFMMFYFLIFPGPG